MQKYLLLFAGFILTAAFGCKKVPVEKTTNITNAQAAVMVSSALAMNADGFMMIKNDVGTYAKTLAASTGKGCAVLDSSAVARQEGTTSNINYNYAFGYYYTVNCVNSVQDNLTAHAVSSGSFDASNLTAVNSSITDLNVASLPGTTGNFNYTGNYQTNGTFQTIDETLLSGNNTVAVTLTSLTVAKSNRAISAGSANVSVSGTVKNKNTFSYNGTLVFKDANTATLTLEGTAYSLNLTTADVTAL